MSRLYLSNPCAFVTTHCTRCGGRSRRPAFPAPSDFRGTTNSNSSDEIMSRECRRLSSPGLTGRSSIPEAAVINREALAYWIPRFRGDDELYFWLQHDSYAKQAIPIVAK